MPRNGKPLGDKSATSLDFIKTLFGTTEGPVNVCALKNESFGKGGPMETTRDPTVLEKFIQRHDKKGWGIYFCVGTMISEEHHHSEDAINEIPFLHVDIDLKHISDTYEEVLRKLKALPLPPSMIVKSGHGAHGYWIFKEAIVLGDNRKTDYERVKDALKLLCDLVGGDQMVTHPAALMRMVGSHNSKENDWFDVVIVDQDDTRRYELDEIVDDMLAIKSPIILRKERPPQNPKIVEGYWESYYKSLNIKPPPMDVAQRLKDMRYMCGTENAIHSTQLSVTASMVLDGRDPEEIVKLVMEATKVAAAGYWERWNHKREERAIRRMIADAQKKKAAGKLGASTAVDEDEEEEQELRTANSGAIIIDFVTRKQQKTENDARAKAAEKKAKAKINLYKRIGVAVLKSLEQCGVRLLITEDQLWRCDSGIWSLPLNGARHSIETEIEAVCELNSIGTEIKLINEVRAWIVRQPELYHEKVAWDAHGKIPTKTGLIDRKTLKLERLTPEHYATWCIPDVEYDPKAECPWWLLGLNDALADRPDDVRKQYIDLLQEVSGVSLLDDKPKALSKALIMVGDSNSGKTTIIEVLSGLHTNDPIATSLDMLGGTHGTMDFQRRVPWTLHEAFDGGKWHPSATIKLIFSGDPFPINIKNGPIINRRFTQPAYWGSNSPVQIREPTNAMRNRLIIIDCRQEFKADELIGIGKEAARLGFEKPHQMILKNERAGLLNWSLAGMQRAMKNAHFTKVDEVEETLDEFRVESNFAAAFLNECAKYGPDYRVSVPDFCASFSVHWIQNKDSDQPVPGNDRIMRAVKLFGDKRIANGKDLREKSRRYICGVHLKPVGLKYWEVAVQAERMTSTMASKIAHTSLDKTEVNRFIPPEWDTKEAIIRLRKADFPEDKEDDSLSSRKSKFPEGR